MAVISAALAAFGYFASSAGPANVSPVFPAAGFGVAIVIAYGHRMLPALFVGLTVADYLNGSPVPLALWIGLATAAGAGLGGELVRRFVPRLSQPDACGRELLPFLFLAAGVATGVTALVGSGGLHLFGDLPVEAIGPTVLTWWFGDAIGVITVAPFVLAWLVPVRRAEALARPRELILMVGGTAVAAAVTFGANGALWIFPPEIPVELALLPFLLWGALRLALVGAATAGFVIAAIGTGATVVGLGPYGNGAVADVQGLQFMLAIQITTMLLLGISTSHKMQLSRQAEAALQQAEYLARHDPLTGLSNRAGLYESLEPALSRASRQDQVLAVCLLDLDGFKEVNDCYGHAVGDAVLTAIADRIREVMRLEDIKARHGGDEFVLVQTDLPDADSARLACQRLVERLNEPFEHDGLALRPRTSIGVALFPQDGDSSDALLVAADQAMYRAKEEGASPVFYRGRWATGRDQARSAVSAVGQATVSRRQC